MSKGLPFDFEIPVTFFEKADAESGKTRRIGGIASLETKDRQDEVVLQRGLDFGDFLHNGWFNDNHSRATDGILGYPEATQFFKKGQKLPDGATARADGHWVEGYLLGTEKANRIWELGKALEKTKRRLGFSVEGKILKRIGSAKKTIAEALVRNVAITNCPVNVGARMELLAKSLKVVEQTEADLDKALGMGEATPGIAPTGPRTGTGAGQILAEESLESKEKPALVLDSGNTKRKEEDEDEETKKSFTDNEAFAWAKKHLPIANKNQIEKFVELTKALKRYGKI